MEFSQNEYLNEMKSGMVTTAGNLLDIYSYIPSDSFLYYVRVCACHHSLP